MMLNWNNYRFFNREVIDNKPKGRKNKTINKEFIEICKYEKNELKKYLSEELKKYYKNIISKDGFLYVKGKDKVVLTAHMDTTKTVEYGVRQLVKDFYEDNKDGKHIIQSPQGIGGDDRCGVYIILEILKRTDLRPSIIFCEDEEIGCIGSGKFAKSKFVDDLKDYYFIIELDRHGNNDLVFYDDVNDDFHDWCTEVTGYTEAYGSCSDISNICPKVGISGVNLSCGYHNEHHDYETVVLEEMENTLNQTIKLIEEGIKNEIRYEYKEYHYYNKVSDYGYSSRYYDYDSYYWNKYNQTKKIKEDITLFVEWDNGYGDKGAEYYTAESESDAWYEFFLNHSNICFDNVMDYEVYDEDVLSSAL